MADAVYQSFLPHKYTLKAGGASVVLPAGFEKPKNIVLIPLDSEKTLLGTPEGLDGLSAQIFQEFIAEKKIRKLDKVPTSYYDANQMVAQEKGAREEAEKKATDLSKTISDKDAEIATLKKQLEELGGAK